MSQEQQYVPDWIRANSDVWASMQDDEGEEEDAADEAAAAADRTCADQKLPVCSLDSADGELYYRVFTFWCVPLVVVARSWYFVAAWFKLPQMERTTILDGGRACAKELGGSMLDLVALLDEPELLAKVPYGEILAVKGKKGQFGETTFFIKYGAVRCLRAVYIGDGGLSVKFAAIAAKFGALNVLKELGLIERKAWCLTSNEVRVTAIENGHLHVLQWLCEQGGGSIGNPNDFMKAARFGHWPIIEWLRTRSVVQNAVYAARCSLWCMQQAAQGGHLEIVRRLHEEGCPWEDEEEGEPWGFQYTRYNICLLAAKENKFEVLRWAKAHGCPWNQEYMAAQQHVTKRIRAWIEAGGPTEEEEENNMKNNRKKKKQPREEEEGAAAAESAKKPRSSK